MSNADSFQKAGSSGGLFPFRLNQSSAPLPPPHSSLVEQPLAPVPSSVRPSVPPVLRRNRVMACLDGSALAECALPLAAFVTRALDGELTLLHVIPSPAGAEPMAFDVLDWEISRREAEQYLEGMRTRLSAQQGIKLDDVRTELGQGRPAARMLSFEQEIEPELTVLCRRGAGGAGSFDLGATAQQMVGGVKGSVLLVPTGMTPAVPPKRILVALDGSFRAESVFPMVQALAHLGDAEVVLLHVVAEPRVTGVLSEPDDIKMAKDLAARLEVGGLAYLSALKERLSSVLPRIKIVVVRRTDTRAALLDLARTEEADMIVLSAHGTTCNSERSLGSVATHTLVHAVLPPLPGAPGPHEWPPHRLHI
jgi:nucleotide-binding universal stress UspA family protein